MNKKKDLILITLGSIAYITAVVSLLLFLSKGSHLDLTIAFSISMIPLIVILVAAFSYGLKFKSPFMQLEYLPVDSVMGGMETIDEEKAVRDAEKLMEERDLDFLGVINRDGYLTGVFTQMDALQARRKRKINTKLKKVMSKDLIFVNKGDNVIDALRKMIESGHSRLPVVDGKKPIGLVRSIDIGNLLKKIGKS
ncbi:MAG: hypothetical protein DRN00_01850 [Thermoplasmata archaeon]|nr:MAG: hypothetical protein DRN03_01415 [Thermoplasmata archaeon]RLF39454.1 MAG: hypothetical protein DRN00_01850 [Thermoplasmata archaeon]